MKSEHITVTWCHFIIGQLSLNPFILGTLKVKAKPENFVWISSPTQESNATDFSS
jgi:hypothetical protein